MSPYGAHSILKGIFTFGTKNRELPIRARTSLSPRSFVFLKSHGFFENRFPGFEQDVLATLMTRDPTVGDREASIFAAEIPREESDEAYAYLRNGDST